MAEETNTGLRRVGRYELLERLGTGGMGEVYLAELVGSGGFRRRCALKMVLPNRQHRADVMAMFEREAVLAARVAHPNVVQVFDFGVDGDVAYLAMELVDGLSLRALCARLWERGEELAVADGCALIADVARGLAAIHALTELSTGAPLGIVHRDVTPDNILIAREGFAKLGDFGIAVADDVARLTETGDIRGKIPYMSPEQLDGQNLTTAADIFALGTSLFYVLTRARPFDRGTDLGTMNAIVKEDAPLLSALRPNAPPALDRLLAAMLSKDPARRPRAAELAALLLDAGAAHEARPATALLRALQAGLGTNEEGRAGGQDAIATKHRLGERHPPGTEATRPSHTLALTQRGRLVARGGFALLGALAATAFGARILDGLEPPGVGVDAGAAVSATATAAHARGPDAARMSGDDAGAGRTREDLLDDAPSAASGEDGRAAPHKEPRVQLRAPPQVTWTLPDGRRLGAGDMDVHTSARTVVARPADTGARCVVPVVNGVARFDTLATGRLDVRANPYAAVSVGSRTLGTTPISPLPALPACTYRLRLVYEGTSLTRTVSVVPNSTTSVRVNMEPGQ